MDIFTKFNRNNIQDRQVDTLIGISKGLTADGSISQSEAEFLMAWLIQNKNSDNPIIINLLEKIGSILEDGILDGGEALEIFHILQSISGDASEIGELAKSSSLPINNPLPALSFKEKSFLFTGTCAFGTRSQCQEAIESLGGVNASGVTKSLHYLILGTYVTDSWAHENYGRKIEKAMEYRSNGVPLVIITESHWLSEAGL